MKGTIGLFVLLAFAAVSGIAFAQSAQSGALSLANVAVSPSPIVAGQNVSIVFQLYNSNPESVADVNLQLTGTYPLLNFSPSSSYLISSVGEGLYTSIFTYKVHVPNNVATGVYGLNFVATYHTSVPGGTVVGTSTMPLSLYVNGIPNLTAVGLVSPATPITPGKPFSMIVRVVNAGYDTAKNVQITLLNGTSFTISGVSNFEIASLPIGGSVNVSATYQASQSIGNNTYLIPIRVSYSSGTGVQYNKTLNLQASVVIQSPQIRLSFVNPVPQALYQGYNQTLQLQIQNIGTGDAKNVSVQLQSGNGVSILNSITSFFVSDLPPGQSIMEPVLLTASGTGTAGINAILRYYAADYKSSFNSVQRLNLSLAPSAQLTVESVKSDLSSGSINKPVTFAIKNTGTIAAQQVQLSMQSTYPVTPVASTYFVSDIEPGATANVTFLVSIDSGGVPGNYPITLFEQWKQPTGAASQTFSGSNNYFVTVGGSSSSTLELIIVAVIIVAVAAFILRGRAAAAKAKAKKPSEQKESDNKKESK